MDDSPIERVECSGVGGAMPEDREWELALRWIEAAQVEVESRAWALRLQMQKAQVYLGQFNFKRAAGISVLM